MCSGPSTRCTPGPAGVQLALKAHSSSDRQTGALPPGDGALHSQNSHSHLLASMSGPPQASHPTGPYWTITQAPWAGWEGQLGFAFLSWFPLDKPSVWMACFTHHPYAPRNIHGPIGQVSGPIKMGHESSPQTQRSFLPQSELPFLHSLAFNLPGSSLEHT